MASDQGLTITPLIGMPLFAPGMDISGAIIAALGGMGLSLRAGDILVVAQKIVSKAEGRLVRLADVAITPQAEEIASQTGREAAMVQLILDQSQEIMRATPAAIIARHSTGHVLANAGIDASNVEGGDSGTVLLWPEAPDISARNIRQGLADVRPGVIIADSLGRAWRMGTQGTAIGVAGVQVLDDRRGIASDLYGRTLQATLIGIADSLAAAAVLAMGEGAEGTPAALVRGAGCWVCAEDGPGAASGLRPIAQDMFR